MEAQTEISQLKLQLKEAEMHGGSAANGSGRGTVDQEKNDLVAALMKSNMELETQKLTKVFEDKERALSQEITKLKEQLIVKTQESRQYSAQLAQKESAMKKQEEMHKSHMLQIQAMERSNRQKLLNSHKNESRVMAAMLHDVSAQLAFSNSRTMTN